jgi:hypothetical protein
MTTDRKAMSGRGQENYIDKLDKYNKDSRNKAVGKHMRTFARTKTSKIITAWNDSEYVAIIGNTFKIVADTTGNVDNATTLSAQMENLLNVAWELFYENANLKDLVAAEEASWKLYFGAMLKIAIEIQLQYNFRCYLPAYTESDTTPGAAAAIAYFSQESFDIFVRSMAEYPVPKGVWEIVDIFCTWVIKLAEEYEAHTLKLPGCYLFPFDAEFDLADLEALRELCRVNWGNMLTHAKKFGLKLGKWRDPVKPKIKKCDDVDVIAFFAHGRLEFYDDGTAGSYRIDPVGGFEGNNRTTDYTNVEYFFKTDPNESLINVLGCWFGTYDATNNIYGGLILTRDASATEYAINVKVCAQHGTTVSVILISTSILARVIALLHKGVCDEAGTTESSWDICMDGDHLTAGSCLVDCWMLDFMNNLHFGKNRGATENDNDVINYFGRLLV